MSRQCTAFQQELFVYIRDYIVSHGYAQSFREIRSEYPRKCTNVIHNGIGRLVDIGLLVKHPARRARNLALPGTVLAVISTKILATELARRQRHRG